MLSPRAKHLVGRRRMQRLHYVCFFPLNYPTS